MPDTTCPCCSLKNYSDCCGRFIDGSQYATTPEELMRSRYTAFTQANIKYIVATMKSPVADNFNAAEAEQWAKNVVWKKLEILAATQNKNKGFVEFVAYIIDKNKDEIIYERSEFHLEENQWYYINGVIPRKKKSPPIVSPNKPGRNDHCPCGSGKKYKKCCE